MGVLSFDDLRERPGVTSSFIQASRFAATTHQQEKLETLKNAVINAVISPDMDDETQTVFLALIDDYRPWHIRLLDFFIDPVACATRRGAETAFDGIMAGGMSTVLERVFPELKGQRGFYNRIAGNLGRDQLVGASGLHVTMSGQGLRQGRATDFGRSFLRFISEPEA